jgi:protein-disulfide isomerase
MKDFLTRNAPVFLIGLVTIGVFITIILAASKNPTQGPSLEKIADENLITDTTATAGPRDSKIVMVEFSDFECPACKTFHPVVAQLIDQYQDRVLFAFKHFPLPQHTSARSAAIASEAAKEQGQFWRFADELFAIQPDFSREKYIEIAEKLMLDVDRFTADLDKPELAVRVDEDLAQARRLGLGQTPTFILNNNLVTLTSFDDLGKLIEEELAKNAISQSDATTQTSQSTPSAANIQQSAVVPNEMDSTYGVIDIEYGFNGFIPTNAKALQGQQVRIKNTLKTDMSLQQLIYHYTDITNPVTIKAGESFSVRLTKEGLWTFKESNQKHYGSVFTVVQE